MGNSETLQKKIDKYLFGLGLIANHDTFQLLGPEGHVGRYEIEESDFDPDGNSVTVNFIIEVNRTTPLPLKVQF